MQFWIRHLTLVALCVFLPFAGALYMDTTSAVDRAQKNSADQARVAVKGLQSRLALEAYRRVADAITIAQRLGEPKLIENTIREETGRARLDAKIADAREKVLGVLREAKETHALVWLVDAEGRILSQGRDIVIDLELAPRIDGHPLFAEVQAGAALDSLWRDGTDVFSVGAAPIVLDGVASGGIVVGDRIDDEGLSKYQEELLVDITLVVGGKVHASTFPRAQAVEVTKDVGEAMEPVSAGRLPAPITHEYLPLLPLVMEKNHEGLAYSSLARPSPAASGVQWVVSVSSASALTAIPVRQELILGLLVAATMLSLLIGLINYRTFVTPIGRVESHLSELQMGRGDLELPETRVSRPFRRLVRLVNMTVQKAPSRTLSGFSAPPSSPALTPELGPADMADRDPSVDLDDVLQSMTNAGLGQSMQPSKPVSSPGPAPEPAPVQDPADYYDAPAPEPGPAGPSTSRDNEAVQEALAAMGVTFPGQQQREAAEPDDVAEEDGTFPGGPLPAQAASAIRGASLPGGGAVAQDRSPFPPSQSEILRGGEGLPPNDPSSPFGGPRGGGSFDPGGLGGAPVPDDAGGFSPEATVVAPVAEDLLARSARADSGASGHPDASSFADDRPDMTVVASVPPDLLAQSASPSRPGVAAPRASSHAVMTPSAMAIAQAAGLDAADQEHFKEVYERFIDMRRRCGEATADLAFDRFLAKLTRNRENLINKYQCRTVRFQVYEKDGKAALKATPVRA